MALAQAKVTVDLADIDSLRQQVKASETRAIAAEKALADIKIDGDDGTGRAYFDAFHEAMVVAQFAVGQLHPLTVRGWPYKSLYALSKLIKQLPGVDPDLSDIANDLKLFADEAKRWEDAREKGIEQEMLAEENSRSGGMVLPDMPTEGPGIEPPPTGPAAA